MGCTLSMGHLPNTYCASLLRFPIKFSSFPQQISSFPQPVSHFPNTILSQFAKSRVKYFSHNLLGFLPFSSYFLFLNTDLDKKAVHKWWYLYLRGRWPLTTLSFSIYQVNFSRGILFNMKAFDFVCVRRSCIDLLVFYVSLYALKAIIDTNYVSRNKKKYPWYLISQKNMWAKISI